MRITAPRCESTGISRHETERNHVGYADAKINRPVRRRRVRPAAHHRGRTSATRQAIATAANRLDQAIVRGRLERFAKPADMNVDRAFLDADMVAPHLVEQVGAAMDALRMRQ